VTFAVGGLYIAVQKLGLEMTKGPLGLALTGLTFLFMAFQAESIGAKIAFGALATGFVAAAYLIAGGFTAVNIASMGIVPALGMLATLVLSIANIFMHKAASPGFITILEMVAKAMFALGKALLNPVKLFVDLAGAIIDAANAT